MAFLDVQGVSKTFAGASAPVLDNINFTLDEGQIAVLLGASGCGKTTILKVIAGLEVQDSGKVYIDGQLMDGIIPEKRPISMVFQKALLFENMTVAQNVNFAPRVNHTIPKSELAAKTEEMLALVGLEGFGRRKPRQLSGGQEQRVSLARALMVHPKLLLLDEPLSALDAALRESMQKQIRALNEKTGVTMIMVTHDQREAVAVADVIAVMHRGKIVQAAAPGEFYTRPVSEYVASFFGWKNFVPATRKGDEVSCGFGNYTLEGLAEHAKSERGIEPDVAEEGFLIVRPEAAAHGASAPTSVNLEGMVTSATYEGATMRYEVACAGDNALTISLPSSIQYEKDQRISFWLEPSMMWFVANDHDRAYASAKMEA